MVILLGRERLQLNAPLDQGGAGKFYAHPRCKELGIKIYLHPEEIEPARIEFLCSNRPPNLKEKGVPTHAWPDLPAYDEQTGNLIGYSMPRVVGALPLQAVVNPSARSPAITRRWLWKVAIYVVKRVHTLHLQNPPHIVGDINFQNFLVHRRGVVSQLDLDSTHFTLPGGLTFTCDRFRPELQPPELVAVTGRVLDRYQHQDAFSVYDVVHRLLREGVHPFDACYVGSGTPLRQTELIEHGIWPDSLRHAEYRPKPGAIPFIALPMALQELFRRMFLDGIKEPSQRPTVTELLTCLELHQPVGARFSSIGRRAWSRALVPSSTPRFEVGRLPTTAKKHKRKAVIAAAMTTAIALGTQIERPRRTNLPTPLLWESEAVGSETESPPNRQLHRRPYSHHGSDGAPFVTPLLPRKGGSALPTPQLWRQSIDDPS